MTVSNLTFEQKVFALDFLNITNTQFKIFFWHVRKRHYLKNKKLSVPCQTVTIEQMAQDTGLNRKTIMRFQKKMLNINLITQRKNYHGKSRHCFNYITEYVKETWKIVEELASLGIVSEDGIDKKKIKKLLDLPTKTEDRVNFEKNNDFSKKDPDLTKRDPNLRKTAQKRDPLKYNSINTYTYRGKPLKKIFYVPKIREENKKGYNFLIGCNVSTYFAAKKSSQYSPKEIHEAVKDAWFYKKFNSINNMEAFLTSRLQNPKKFYPKDARKLSPSGLR